MGSCSNWAISGGVPPWFDLNPEDCWKAVSDTAAKFLGQIESLKSSSPHVFSWRVFCKLDSLWASFDSIHRLFLGADMLQLDGFSAYKVQVELLYSKLSAASSESRILYRCLKSLRTKNLRAWQLRAIDRSGFGASAYEKKSVKTVRNLRLKRIADLEKECEKNIDQAIESSPVWTNEREHLNGVPDWLIAEARARAKSKGLKGWLFYANYRNYRNFMASSHSREMRKRMYQVRSKAGSEFTPKNDNASLARKILSLRRMVAKEYGYASYADYALSENMITTPERVDSFLLSCADAAVSRAYAERQELDLWMKNICGVQRLEPWDYRYARQQVLTAKTNGLMGQAVKFFPAIGTITRAVEVVGDFFGVKPIRCREFEVNDLLVYKVEHAGRPSGWITIAPKHRKSTDDMVAYEWMLSTTSENRMVEPSSLVFLQLQSSGQKLMNMSHNEVVILFHELGHAFHSILGLGRVSTDSPSGIEADALEMPSQLVENLAWDAEVLQRVGRFAGRRMSLKMAAAIADLRDFHAGAWTISQVTDALCDMRLHTKFNPRGRLNPWEIMLTIRGEVGLDRVKSYNRQVQQMGTFTGSYVCSDYSYLWSEGVAFAVFKKWRSLGGFDSKSASALMASAFFKYSARVSTSTQVKGFVKNKASNLWLAQSRGFV